VRQDNGYGTALKDALGKVAPATVAKPAAPKPEPKKEMSEPAGLPEDVLRSMLAVDPEVRPEADNGAGDTDDGPIL
jgi:hypothetical protein